MGTVININYLMMYLVVSALLALHSKRTFQRFVSDLKSREFKLYQRSLFQTLFFIAHVDALFIASVVQLIAPEQALSTCCQIIKRTEELL